MRKVQKAHNRVRGGLKLFALKYWSAFCSGSFAIHILSLFVVSALALQFIQSLSRPAAPGPGLMYVQLIYPEPMPLARPSTAAPPENTPTKRTPASEIVSKRKSAPEKAGAESRGRAADSKLPDRAKRLAKVERARKRVPPPLPKRKGPGADTLPRAEAPDEKEPPASQDDEPAAVKEESTPVSDALDEDAITVIRGTEITKLTVIEPAQKEPSTPPDTIVQGPEEDWPGGTGGETGDVRQDAGREAPPPPMPVVAETGDVPGSELFSNISSVREPGRPGLPYYVLSAPAPLENFTVSMGLPRMVVYTRNVPVPADSVLYRVPPELASVYRESADVSGRAEASVLDRGGEAGPYPLREMALENYSLAMAALSLPPAGFDLRRGAAAMLAEKESSMPPVRLPAPGRGMPVPDAVVSGPKLIVFEDIFDEPDEAPFVEITEPGPGDTDKSIVELRGVVAGIGVDSVDLSVKGQNTRLFVKEGGFSSTVVLAEGRNTINATAIDAAGRVARSRVVVNYVPTPTGPALQLVRPKDGETIDAIRKKELEITGTVDGKGVDEVRIYLNDTVLTAGLSEGKFSVAAPLLAESNRLYAEATNASGLSGKSEEISFSVENLHPKDVSVSMESSSEVLEASLVCSWRKHPLAEKLNVQYSPKDAPAFETASSPGAASAFASRLVPGIYTVSLDYDTKKAGSAAVKFRVTIYGYDKAKKKTRTAGPFRLTGKGRVKAVRIMLPDMVLWEDDSYFSGLVEGPGYTIKYREPEGISWKEED